MGEILRASTSGEIISALAQAKGGDTILLAGGEYGMSRIRATDEMPLNFPDGVTIASANADDPAVFTGLSVSGGRNLTFDGIVFDYRFAEGDESWTNTFGFFDVDGLTVRNCIYDGDLAQGVSADEDGFGFGTGLIIRGCEKFTFENNEMFQFWKGIKVFESEDVILRGNDIHSMRMDGINFAEVEKILIEDNYIHDFKCTTLPWDHSDMIQAWTVNSDQPSRDIVIRGNTLDIGHGDSTQSIFLGNSVVDSGQAGAEMNYQNVTIQDNLIVNGSTHGISLGASTSVVVSGNTVVHADGSRTDGLDSAVEIPRISISAHSQNVKVTDNIVAAVLTDRQGNLPPDWTIANNLFVQDTNPSALNHYQTIFVSSSIDSHDFIPLTNGPAVGLGLPFADGLIVQFHASMDPDNSAARSFDATTSVLNKAELPAGTLYTWDFGDGTEAEGAQVHHVFPDVGTYPVILTVTAPDRSASLASHQVTVNDPQLVSYSAGGAVEMTCHQVAATLDVPSTIDVDGIVLGQGQGAALTIPRLALMELFTAKSFSIEVSMTLTENSTGTLFRFGREISARVETDGSLIVRVMADNSDVPIFLRTHGIDLADGNSHETTLRLASGQLEIWTDGTLENSHAMNGSLANTGNYDFWLGTPWGASVAGAVDAIKITADAENFAPQIAAPVLEDVSSPLQFAPEDIAASNLQDLKMSGDDQGAVVLPLREGDEAWIPVLDFQGGNGFSAYTSDGRHMIDASLVVADSGLLLGETGVSGAINRGYVDMLPCAERFKLAFTVQSDNDDSNGQLINLSGSISTLIRPDGNLMVRVDTQDDGVIRYTTEGFDISDGTPRDVVLDYTTGHLDVMIDGAHALDVDLPSPMSGGNSAGLIFGNSWGHDNFTGVLEHFSVDTLDMYRDGPAEFSIFLDANTAVIEDAFMM